MIIVKLREAMDEYKLRTGRRMTYEILAEQTGLSSSTLRIIGCRHHYNATIDLIEKLCRTLDTDLHDMLEMTDAPPKPKRKRPPKKK